MEGRVFGELPVGGRLVGVEQKPGMLRPRPAALRSRRLDGRAQLFGSWVICAINEGESGRHNAECTQEFFRRAFNGKVVLFGTLLDVEDRKITSKRWATAPERAPATRCALPQSAAGSKFTRDSIAGVYVHATAVNNLLRGDALVEFGRGATGLFAFVLAGLASMATLALGPALAALATLGLAAAWTAGATIAFREALALPLIVTVLSK